MYLDERSSAILRDLAAGFRKNSGEIEEKFRLTRRQMDYSLKKINAYLAEQNIPPVKKKRNGNLEVGKEIREVLRQKKDYFYSETERVQIIAFMILTQSDLSLQHFISELKVSKNTVLSDLKAVQQLFADYGSKLKYTRQQGYIIDGKEFEKRKLLIDMAGQLICLPDGRQLARKLGRLKEDQVQKYRDWLETIERKLDVTFTDEKMDSSPYCLALVCRRIKDGKYLDEAEMLYEELTDTKEYAMANELLAELGKVPRQERFFIALMLLSANISELGILSEEKVSVIRDAIEEMVHDFENKACVVFKEREELKEMLLKHMKPAYYRMKYNLTLSGNLLDIVNIEMYQEELKEIHTIMRGCIGPVEQLIGSRVPDAELKFLTLFMASWFRRQGTKITEKPRALVVCPNGITVSKIMHSALKDLFPEFIFLDAISVREFEEWEESRYEFVFSSVYLNTEKKLFVVEPVLSQKERRQLRRQVMEEVYGIAVADYDLEEVLRIIKQHGMIRNEMQLLKDLKKYFSSRISDTGFGDSEDQEDLSLMDFLSDEYIIQIDRAEGWREVMQMASGPLISHGNAEERYVKRVLAQYHDNSVHIIFGGRIAVPHAMPDKDTKRVGLSLVTVKEGVLFGGLNIHLFVMLSPVDEKKHLKAILQLSKLSESERDVRRIAEAGSKEEIREIIKTYC